MGLAVAVRIASELTGRLQLSVFPCLLERLIYSRHEPSVELTALSRLIRMDPALCFMTMRLDRSMGSNSHTADNPGVDAVVRRIGMAGIDAITTQAMADQALNGIHHQQGLALGWLWRHCLTTALLAQGLALELDFRPVEEAYTAGLLHDIGKLALFARTPAACAPMLSDPDQASQLLKAEEQVAESDHCRIGAQLIRRYTGAWFASDAARYHAAASAEVINALPLVQIVWAANRLARDPYPSSEACQTVSGLLNLNPRQLNPLLHKAQEHALAAANELGVVADMPEKDRTTGTHTVPLSQEIRTSTVLSSVYGELLTATDHDAIVRVLRQSLSVFMGIDDLILFDHDPHRDILIGRFPVDNVFPIPIDRLHIPLTASDCLPVICHVSGEAMNSFSRARQGKLTIIDRQLMAYMHKDGIVCMPVRSGTGHGTAVLLLGIDAGDRTWVEQQTTLLKAIVAAVAGAMERERQRCDQKNSQATDRIESIESKTRKIVHEINNPLSIIKNYLKVLTLRTDEKSSGKNELRIIDEEISRVTGLIKALTSPSDKIPVNLETVDVNATITDILSIFHESLPKKTSIRLSSDLDAHIPVIASDRDRLKQALINLLKNAMEAMPDGGTIQVSTRMVKSSPGHIDDKEEAGHIKISVCDDGPGIDERIKNDLFKPNVTSKTGHDGLGLSIVHEAVTRLKGSLVCESAPGGGTCFHIELPAGGSGSKNGTTIDSDT
ncbi:HDOD domain-containing protein [uncultured Desulfosarcina sp.]|uniref:HDOD domain-containing protein n=1 Tax=uncultured Desulfosarcina sp. TaxID=218289 RepID=UPI0029C68716|nr:HDOD domain-containing protein [uncultured Desulfosarcina sp.]